MAMPWSRAKEKERDLLEGRDDPKRLTALFDACFRIQREAIEAAGHFIPLVVENVRGAQKWVGRSRWNYGSFHLWGDVPALMPMTRAVKVAIQTWSDYGKPGYKAQAFNGQKVPGFRFDGSGRSFQTASVEGMKTVGHANKRDGHSHTRHLTNQAESDGIKQHKSGRAWFADPDTMSGKISSKSPARKAASAAIAKIPLPLARHIAAYWKPQRVAA